MVINGPEFRFDGHAKPHVGALIGRGGQCPAWSTNMARKVNNLKSGLLCEARSLAGPPSNNKEGV